MAVVNLKLRRTSEKGFLVILRAKNLDEETEGFLPPLLPELESSFNQWQTAYRQIEAVRSCVAPAPGLRLTPKSVTIHSHAEHTGAVKDYLNQWLNSGDSKWRPIRDRLIAIAQQLHQSNDEIRVIIDAVDIDLRRLPWQVWNLFEEHYPQTEIALSAPKSANQQTNKLVPKSIKIRILVAVGRSDGINTKDDLKVIQDLEKHGVEVVCLIQPSRKELCEALWDEKGYHIFVFTGHSGSQEDGQIGWIELNNEDSLTIEEFKEAFKQAIHKGLQLGIFNSCDGLGLANQIAQLHLPQIIIMREPVPDPVAVEFLKYFFQEFSRNNSLFTSVQKARKRLEHFKSDYPGAIWLPTICIEPNFEPLNWQGLCGVSPRILPPVKPDNSIHQPHKNIKPWLLTGLISVAIGSAAYIGWNIFLPSPPTGTFRDGGSTSYAPIRALVNEKIKKKWPQFKLIYWKHPSLPQNSGTGIKMLLEGQISFAESSRFVNDDESERATTKRIKLKQVAVAMDAIAIVVNRDLNIPGLTIDQLKDIYTRKVSNWKEVGGPDIPITPYFHSGNGGSTAFLKDSILGNNQLDLPVTFVSITPTEILNLVKKSPGGIYYASAPQVINQCSVKTIPIILKNKTKVAPDKPGKMPGKNCPWEHNKINIEAIKNNTYPLSRYLFIIIKQDGQEDEKAGEFLANYLLTAEGQDLVQQAGFVRVR
ncbi:substrate-binding domain-containing protein [Desmonostoc muscorum CCALA 125]|nr:substrate-binding domain-containing protein [Desmonostoc muscorum CCALA 125]